MAPYQVNYAAKADFLKLRELNLELLAAAGPAGPPEAGEGRHWGVVAQNLFTIRAKDNVYGDPET